MTQPRPIPSVLLDDTDLRARTQDRVFDKIDWPSSDEACWDWTGAKFHYGHGRIGVQVDGKTRSFQVHRLTYAWEYGDQPLPLDHLCANTSCVNPRHLQPVTVRTNTLRGEGPTAVNAQRTHCVNGHPLYGDNLYMDRGRRRCRECGRQRHRKWDANQERKTPARKGDRRTHCKFGHEATPENTYYRKDGTRECRVCHRERERARQRKLRE